MESEIERLKTENERLNAELNHANQVVQQVRDLVEVCGQMRKEIEDLVATNEKLQTENAIARVLIERVDAMSAPKPKKRRANSKGFGYAYKP